MSARARAAVERMAAQQCPRVELLDRHPANGVPAYDNEPLGATEWIPDAGRGRQRSTRRRSAVLVAAAATLALIGAVVFSLPHVVGSRAYAATAPTLRYVPTAASKETVTDMLTQLANLAAAQPNPPGSGPYHYVRTKAWDLSTDVTTQMQVLESHIAVSERQQWIASDGSGELKVTTDGPAARVSGVYGPGKLAAQFITGVSVEDLQRALTRQFPRNSSAFDWVDTFRQVWNRQVVSPDLQATMLRILAAQPGLAISGATTDRDGRSGIAVSAQSRDGQGGSPALRCTLVFNPATGMLMDYERVALDAGSLPIQAPATTGYTVWLASGYTHAVSEIP